EVTQHLARDRARGHAADGLSRAGAAAALPVADAVLRLVRVVGVRGTVEVAHLLVRFGPRVLVAHQDQDRRAEGLALEDSRKYLAAVGFGAGRSESALTRPAAVELDLDLGRAERQPRGTAVDDHADGAAVRLTPGVNAEEMAEGRAHGAILATPAGGQ